MSVTDTLFICMRFAIFVLRTEGLNALYVSPL